LPKEVMRRSASDNQYLHRDFHGALSEGIEYLHERFGEEAVREYQRDFTRTYFSPLIADFHSRGLEALRDHFKHTYEIEGAPVEISINNDELILRVPYCPAVKHMRENEYRVARLFHETTKTVNEALVEGSDFEATLVEYDPQTGASVQRFARRKT
jgi:hypothetical protein